MLFIFLARTIKNICDEIWSQYHLIELSTIIPNVIKHVINTIGKSICLSLKYIMATLLFI